MHTKIKRPQHTVITACMFDLGPYLSPHFLWLEQQIARIIGTKELAPTQDRVKEIADYLGKSLVSVEALGSLGNVICRRGCLGLVRLIY